MATEKGVVDLTVPGSEPGLAGHAADWVRPGKLDDALAVSEAAGLRRDERSSQQDFQQLLTAWEDGQWQKACDQDGPTSYA